MQDFLKSGWSFEQALPRMEELNKEHLKVTQFTVEDNWPEIHAQDYAPDKAIHGKWCDETLEEIKEDWDYNAAVINLGDCPELFCLHVFKIPPGKDPANDDTIYSAYSDALENDEEELTDLCHRVGELSAMPFRAIQEGEGLNYDTGQYLWLAFAALTWAESLRGRDLSAWLGPLQSYPVWFSYECEVFYYGGILTHEGWRYRAP